MKLTVVMLINMCQVISNEKDRESIYEVKIMSKNIFKLKRYLKYIEKKMFHLSLWRNLNWDKSISPFYWFPS